MDAMEPATLYIKIKVKLAIASSRNSMNLQGYALAGIHQLSPVAVNSVIDRRSQVKAERVLFRKKVSESHSILLFQIRKAPLKSLTRLDGNV